jgi:hypothetical protein
MKWGEYHIFQYVNLSLQNDSCAKRTKPNDEQSECKMKCRPNGKVEARLFLCEGFDVVGLFRWDCLNKPPAGITTE